MIKRKIKLYYKALIQLFFKFLYGKILVPKNFKNLLDQQKIDNPLFKTYANKSYHLYKVTNARIFTDNNENVAIIKDNFILPKISFQQVNGRLKSVKQNSVIKKGTVNKSTVYCNTFSTKNSDEIYLPFGESPFSTTFFS